MTSPRCWTRTFFWTTVLKPVSSAVQGVGPGFDVVEQVAAVARSWSASRSTPGAVVREDDARAREDAPARVGHEALHAGPDVLCARRARGEQDEAER